MFLLLCFISSNFLFGHFLLGSIFFFFRFLLDKIQKSFLCFFCCAREEGKKEDGKRQKRNFLLFEFSFRLRFLFATKMPNFFVWRIGKKEKKNFFFFLWILVEYIKNLLALSSSEKKNLTLSEKVYFFERCFSEKEKLRKKCI